MSAGRGWRTCAAVTLCLAALTAVVTCPPIVRLTTHVRAHHDALFSVWWLVWFAHQLPHDPLRLFDADIFHRTQNTFRREVMLLFEDRTSSEELAMYLLQPRPAE